MLQVARALTLAMVMWSALSLPAAAEGDPVKGKELAVEHCAKCHVIGDHNPYGGINSTPSFFIFARKPQVYTERVMTFDQRRPHIALDLDVELPEIEHIQAYVDTLKVE
ncbi:MAG: hypothetical protein AAF495_12625 [Pseudomonadota bacterium]